MKKIERIKNYTESIKYCVVKESDLVELEQEFSGHPGAEQCLPENVKELFAENYRLKQQLNKAVDFLANKRSQLYNSPHHLCANNYALEKYQCDLYEEIHTAIKDITGKLPDPIFNDRSDKDEIAALCTRYKKKEMIEDLSDTVNFEDKNSIIEEFEEWWINNEYRFGKNTYHTAMEAWKEASSRKQKVIDEQMVKIEEQDKTIDYLEDEYDACIEYR